jgi:hypothetical protein
MPTKQGAFIITTDPLLVKKEVSLNGRRLVAVRENFNKPAEE